MQRVDLDLLERRIPDVVSTDDVPDLLAAEVDFLASRHARWVDSPTAAPVVRARAMVAAGAIEEAREIIDRLDLRRLTDGEALIAAWAVSRCGSASRAHDLLDRLTVVADDFVVDGVPYGPVALGIGQLHGVLGQVDDALEALRRAVSVADGRLPMWGALARVELARGLVCADAVDGRPGARLEADRAATSALTFLTAGGYRALRARVEHDLDGCAPGGATSGVLHGGERWTVGLGLQPSVEVEPRRGLVALQYLIAHRHRHVTAVELAMVIDGAHIDDVPELFRRRAIDAQISLDDRFESTARRQGADPSDTDVVRALLIDESARSRVTKLIRRTVAFLATRHRLVGEHLAVAVTTGHQCRYTPPGTGEVNWSLEPR